MTEITREERQREDQAILQQFPILDGSFTYLDNGATTQKPQCVLDAMMHYYTKENANPMRGLYDLSIKATEAYEDARETVRAFINARAHEDRLHAERHREPESRGVHLRTRVYKGR